MTPKYQMAQVRGARLFLRTLLANPDADINALVHRYAATSMLRNAAILDERAMLMVALGGTGRMDARS